MIQLDKISLAFGGQKVLYRLSWTVKLGLRIGLIGANGAGKTTLLRVLAGYQDVDSGAVARASDVGYLAQDLQEVDSDRTVLEEAMQAFEEVLALQEEEERIAQELSRTSEGYDKVLRRLERVQSRLAVHDASRMRPRTEAVLAGLGFGVEDLERPVGTLSGGYRMRVALAQILLRQPDVLLLDEPTNHLDILSIDWLETYLTGYAGTVVLVSHDRYFLNRMVTSIAHLDGGKITDYAGNYSFFLTEREKRRELHQAAYENQQRQIAQTKRFIERFRYKNTKARQVQSRIKQLERMERITPPAALEAQIIVRFPPPPRSGRTVMYLSQFSKIYPSDEGDIRVFDRAGPLEIERGDKIALIGKNGAGKSTLARMLHGTEAFDGIREVGYHVERTFFAQHQAETLNPAHTVLEAMQELARGQDDRELRTLLGAFLFRGDDVFKPVRVLSGGEKSRVALARTLLTPANFLILDEPTNHLDIQSIQVLIEALNQYSGSFVVVSHDRHFLDQVVNTVWHAGGGSVRAFRGTYTDYRWYMEHGTARLFQRASASTPRTRPAPKKASTGGPKTKEQKRIEAEARNRAYRAMQQGKAAELTLRQLRSLCEATEQIIRDKEESRRDAETALTDPAVYGDPARAAAMGTTYATLKRELETLYDQWADLAQELQGLEAGSGAA